MPVKLSVLISKFFASAKTAAQPVTGEVLFFAFLDLSLSAAFFPLAFFFFFLPPSPLPAGSGSGAEALKAGGSFLAGRWIVWDRNSDSLAHAGPTISYRTPEDRMMVERDRKSVV